jgi:hypothetical protein
MNVYNGFDGHGGCVAIETVARFDGFTMFWQDFCSTKLL